MADIWSSRSMLRNARLDSWFQAVDSGLQFFVRMQYALNYATCFKLFWYKIFVHWKSKLLNVLVDSVLIRGVSYWVILKMAVPRKRKQDSLGFWIPRRGFWILGTGLQPLSVELGFCIPIVSRILDSSSCIPKPRISDSTKKIFPDSAIRIPLHWATWT